VHSPARAFAALVSMLTIFACRERLVVNAAAQHVRQLHVAVYFVLPLNLVRGPRRGFRFVSRMPPPRRGGAIVEV